ncbi:MAG TPA: hypothetical protein VF826_00830 [Chloroflexia bacterium]|jgi:hypothetical protein
MQASTWETMTLYGFSYITDTTKTLLSDYAAKVSGTWQGDSSMTKLTLKNIQRFDKQATIVNGVPTTPINPIPPITFTYSLTTTSNTYAGTGTYPDGGWNRLTEVDNGQGGKVSFTHQHIGTALAASVSTVEQTAADKFSNNRRVTSRTLSDGFGNAYTWNYAYHDPAFNSLGTSDSLGTEKGPNQWPNSASVFYATHSETMSNTRYLIHPAYSEFRGHRYVVETLPTSTTVTTTAHPNQVEHWFIQGDLPGHGNGTGATCAIANDTGDAMLEDACFEALRDREFLKGSEEKTVVHAGTVNHPVLSETNHKFAVAFKGYPNDVDANNNPTYPDARFGLWRAFTYENETVDVISEGTGSPVSRSIRFEYDTDKGNLTKQLEYNGSGVPAVLYRQVEHNYAGTNPNDNDHYILDRARKDTVLDGGGNLLAHTIYGWDGSSGEAPTVVTGELTLVRKYFNLNVPPSQFFPSQGHSADTTHAYDTYGNTTTITTYPNAGVTTYTYSIPNNPTSLSVSYGTPGNCTQPCTAGRTKTTAYDGIFHALPMTVTHPTAGGVTLIENAGYDLRMSAMTSATDLNGNTTEAEYDSYGRMNKLIKPGDTTNAPTAEFRHDDNEYVAAGKPFRYVQKLWVTEPDNSRTYKQVVQFYDGMGRQIQTRNTSKDNPNVPQEQCAQVIVADNQYDAFGQVLAQSMPRYVDTPNGCTQTGGLLSRTTRPRLKTAQCSGAQRNTTRRAGA